MGRLVGLRFGGEDRRRRRALRVAFPALLVVASSALLFVGGSAAATHGIGFQKGCNSPTKIGDPVVCHYTITNNNFTNASLDTVKINSLADITHAAGGDTPNTNILGNLELFVTAGTPTCVATGGTGTFADPWTGVTECTLPGGNVISGPRLGLWSEIQSKDHNGYVTQPADYNIHPLTHALTDDGALGWKDVCDIDPTSCNDGQQSATAPSATVLIKRTSLTATDIHNAAHGIVTIVGVRTPVHDFVTVTTNDPDPNNPIPHGGDVLVEWFENGTCTAPAADSATVGPVDATGHLEATAFTKTPTAAGHYAFRAHYLGDGTYDGSDGPCEPLTVVDANIQITPATATNAVGTNHTLTCHINVNDGNGQVNAPDGTICTVAIISGPGTPTTQNCTVTGGLGNCQVVITSTVTGTSVIRASTNVTVAGVVLHRETGDAQPGDGPDAQKVWVNANIQITPATDTNAVNTNHVLTITVNAIGGTIDAGPHTATASIVSGPGSFVGPNTCTYTGGAATASCTVTITSAAVGTTVVSATSDIPVNGVTITRTTNTAVNTAAGGSGNASKVWVNANIQITPATDTNAVNTNHVLTITVNAINGTIDAGPHTATASIVSGPGSFVGPNTCTYTGGAATASCTVTITSAAVGTTVVSATSDIPVNGQTITRTTNTAVNTAAGGSGNASKVWVNANISITPATATNPVGTNHVLTITVNAINGTIDAGPHTATASIISGPGSFVGSPTCTYTGGGATASCTVTITSAVVGTTVVQATSDIPVNGQTITRTTGTVVNTAAGGSGNASKIWQFSDANIQINPPTANNAVGTNHTLTGHVNVDTGGGFVNAPNGTVINFQIVSGPGSFVGGISQCTTAGGTGSCTVQITSGTTGTTVVKATTDVVVNGQTLHRETDATGTNSGPAAKNWADDTVRTDVHNAAHAVITTANAGDVVHDKVFVAKAAGTPAAVPNPTGNVVFHRFATLNCTGAAVDQTVALAADGTAESSGFTATGDMSYKADYLGDVNYPAHSGACEPLHVIVQTGQITPTQVDCDQFASGTAPTQTDIFYKASGGVIGQSINPGVFFYWTHITTTVANQVVTVSQTNTSTNNAALFLVHQGWDRLYKGDCSSYKSGTEVAGGSGASFTVLTPGDYIIGIKYQTKSIAGTPAPVPANIVYNFTTNLGPTTAASVKLTKQ